MSEQSKQDVEKRLRQSIEQTLTRDADRTRCECVMRMDASACAIHGPAATEEPTP